jgi:hypothetical protein
MSLRLLKSLVNIASLGAWLVAGSSLAQPSGSPAPAPASPPSIITPPVPSAAKCPVDTFRELLAMTESERNQFLTNRSLVSQRMIQAKIKDYLELSPETRELRLRATELHWYLAPLMNAPATNRAAQLAAIPEQVRPLVEDRLRLWDTLPADTQKRLLAPAADVLATQAARARESSNRVSMAHVIISPARRQWLEKGIRHWQEMSEEQQQEIASQFYRYFELTPQEKAKAVHTLSPPEQRQIEQTLVAFENLSPEKRAECVVSFDKFASLSVEERQQFLENAQRWETMTPTERQTWRDLVAAKLSPPRPARLHLRLPRRPPVPAVATNQN